METKNNIEYSELKPDISLSDFVKCFWRFNNISSARYDSIILPDGCFDIIVEIRDYKIQNILLTGLWTNQIDISVAGNTVLFGIRFKLLSVEYILQQNISSIVNNSQIIGSDFWNINSLITLDFTLFCNHITTKLISIVGDGKGTNNRKVQLFNNLYHTNGSSTVLEYANIASWSSRQINRYFSNKFGLSLKAYCNILKVFASLSDVKKGKLFPEQNYFDQSHFIKEVRKHTGVKPKELSDNKNDRFLQLLTMSEK
ncbi:MAG: AraC family transcriptional regulator [Bacteroidales bacterium]|nr:AraC family transcriptional regulator [Bacteroidales bacterium]